MLTIAAVSEYLPGSWIKIFAAGTGVAFISYAVYFDRKRRLDPTYKQKIRQNRKLKQEQRFSASSAGAEFPDPSDAQSNEHFFFQQISLGEERLQTGNVEEGITHLSNAVITCQQPGELLKIFQQTILPDHFNLLIQALPAARMRRQASIHRSQQGGGVRIVDASAKPTDESGEEGDAGKRVFLLHDDELE